VILIVAGFISLGLSFYEPGPDDEDESPAISFARINITNALFYNITSAYAAATNATNATNNNGLDGIMLIF